MAASMQTQNYPEKLHTGNSKHLKRLHESKVTHLDKLAYTTFSTCPLVARFYFLKRKILEAKKDVRVKNKVNERHCPYCYVPRLPGSHTVRVRPKMKLTAKVRRLVKKHMETPGRLGKFQQKLVNDYIHGGNTVGVRCLSCQKTEKLPGLSRHEKAQQVLKQELEDAKKATLTGKEKKREKKKQQKRKKKDQREAAETNAGLTVALTPTKVNGCDIQGTNIKGEQEKSCHMEDDASSTVSSNQMSDINSLQDRNSPSNQKMSIDSQSDCSKTSKDQSSSNELLRNVVLSSQKGTKHEMGTKHTPGAVAFKPNNVTTSSQRKKKKTNLHQQLGKFLKLQEEKKQGEGTLADFLSSL